MRAIRYVISLFTLILMSFLPASAQDNPAQSETPQKKKSINAKIMYTGRLMGYFRLPDRQGAKDKEDFECPKTLDSKSEDVQAFLEQANKEVKSDANEAKKEKVTSVLVGMGDNFAPELFARVFKDTPDESRRYKDGYIWDWVQKKWVKNEDCNEKKKGCHEDVIKAIPRGEGRIPMDNVGCFLARAKYDAIVPGKHDFYFGPERLRYLARFLASIGPTDPNYQPVQMLATNLVIQTTYFDNAEPAPNSHDEGDYLTPSDTAKLRAALWGDTNVVNFSDKQAVLPWLEKVILKSDDESLKGVTAELWEAERTNPNKRKKPLYSDIKIIKSESTDEKDKNNYEISLQSKELERDGNYLKPDENYMICLKKDTKLPYCVRFSVYSPFFSFKIGDQTNQNDFKDPKPYYLQEPENGTEVAIFGVIDQELREHVGRLNFAWSNSKNGYKTEILVIDPVIALTQLMQKFDRENPSFSGLKILLAQMSAPKARQLAAQLNGKFNVVISEAQLEHATPNQTLEINLDGMEPDKNSPRDGLRPKVPFFQAVPPPYFDSDSKKRSVQVRELSVVQNPDEQQKWRFAVTGRLNNVARHEDGGKCEKFEERVFKALDKILSGTKEDYTRSGEEAFRNLTLHTMLNAVNADVALIQKRDIFLRLSTDDCNSKLQEQLDRVLWKGDFLMRRQILGKTLTDVLARSKQYDTDDQSPVSLASERNRGLVTMGIKYDSGRKEYLINGIPIDPNRLYTVATSDYIGLGDTGFPELAQPAVGDPQSPRDFNTLLYLSSLICKQIKDSNSMDTPCENPVIAEFYFDPLGQEPTDLRPRITNLGRLIGWALHRNLQPKSQPALLTVSELIERERQDSPLLQVALEKASFGFSSSRHRFGEEGRVQRFAGLSIPQLTARRSHSWDFDEKVKITRAGKYTDLYAIEELRYFADVTRQESGPTLTNQKMNLFAMEGGTYLHWTKNLPRLVFLLGPRYETQIAKPISVFKLQSGNSLVFRPGRSESLILKLGPRFEDRKSWIEGGYEFGQQFNAITQFVFNPDSADEVICVPTAKRSIQACITEDGKSPSPKITSESALRIDREARFRHGLFLNFKLVVPLHPKLSYIIENQGEFFLTRPGDNSTDTRYLDIFKQTLSIPLIGNLYFEPKFELFLYQNKVDRQSFWQTQTSFTVNYKFNWFKGNNWRDILRYKDPASK